MGGREVRSPKKKKRKTRYHRTNSKADSPCLPTECPRFSGTNAGRTRREQQEKAKGSNRAVGNGRRRSTPHPEVEGPVLDRNPQAFICSQIYTW